MAIGLGGYQQQKKRRVFFSFHYKDIMRVNNVRKSDEFSRSSSDAGRSIEGYYDASLWESRKLEGDEGLKRLIRDGVKSTSAVCVLVGSETWHRRWVRYEIARSVIDGRGLLAVHINSIKHHVRLTPDERGDNPCRYLGVAVADNGKYYLCERFHQNGIWSWRWYQDYTQPIDLPAYCRAAPKSGEPVRLSEMTREYDWGQNGFKNIGGWIDMAAADAGK
ncbi:TIR domain-containing protein [Ensifer sp. 22521]|uniref:TIR domain-containing protein n=1 Tax=Ensifer sp. 22521 TaxID=3453935 RepID=UPI003F82CA46